MRPLKPFNITVTKGIRNATIRKRGVNSWFSGSPIIRQSNQLIILLLTYPLFLRLKKIAQHKAELLEVEKMSVKLLKFKKSP
jgi:hypothetical protein